MVVSLGWTDGRFRAGTRMGQPVVKKLRSPRDSVYADCQSRRPARQAVVEGRVAFCNRDIGVGIQIAGSWLGAKPNRRRIGRYGRGQNLTGQRLSTYFDGT